MVTSLPHFLLLFVFLALRFNANTAFEAYVHVKNALPGNTDQVSLTCLSRDTGEGFRGVRVAAGRDYRWKVGKKVSNRCNAMWNLKFGLWNAYHPKRDANHGQVFWLVKENGFFLSWDNATWVKKSTWETE